MQHMEVIPEEEVPVEPSKSFYLPHHDVMKELSTTTNLIVAFDGSALTTNGNSLNGNLMLGAKQQDDIFGVLLRFQLHAVALSAYIEKIALSEEAKDFHRIAWRPDPNEEFQHLRMTRVTYGICSSSYHSIRSVRSVGDGDSVVDEVILSGSYVDDFLTGAESIDEAKELRNELQEKLLGGGSPLRKWSSSSFEVLKDLPPHLLETKDVLELNKEDKSIKALGVVWYSSRDVFCFRYNGSFETGSTKRKLFSEIAKFFDPLGWIAPITITLKMLMQATWVKGFQWYDTLRIDLEETWQAAHEQLNALHQIQFLRSICSESKRNIELHIFADASEKAYAAVLYARVEKLDGSVTAKLHACKTKVAPLESISFPKLELCAAHLAVRFMKCFRTIYKTRFKVSSIHAWSDSTITLAWISGEPRRRNTFVSNRVSGIIYVISPSDWKHVPTEFNPADLASRGSSLLSLMESSLWWSSPEWLTKPVAFWPHKIVSIMRTNLEEKKTASVNAMQMRKCLMKFQSFSGAKRLIRTWAFVN